MILVSVRRRIIKIDLTSPEYISEELPLQNILLAIGLDYDYTNDTVYWTDVTVSVFWAVSQQ